MATFAELRQKTEQARLDSDLQNLATAHVLLGEAIVEHEEKIERMKAIQGEIEAMGNGATPPTLSQVKALYQKAHNAR